MAYLQRHDVDAARYLQASNTGANDLVRHRAQIPHAMRAL
jgi:hypothetical protein